METRSLIVTVAVAIIGVHIGLFAWLKSDIGTLIDRIERVERAVAFVRGQLSLVLPALAQQATPAESKTDGP